MKILKILVVAIELGLTAGISAEPEPRNPVAEGLSSDVKEVDVDQLDGNQLWFALRKMEHDQPRLDATVKRLTGRVVTFENVPFVRVLEKSSADGFVRVELGCPGKDRKRDYDWDFRMDVRFPTGLEGVECLDPRIRLQSVKVRFLGTPNCMGVSFDGLAVVVPPAADPLVGKDAKKITGDQLADLVYEEGLERRQYAVLQRRLAGRRLTFHPSWLRPDKNREKNQSWLFDVWSHRQAERTKISANLSPDMHISWAPSYPLNISVRCTDSRINELLGYVRSDPGLHVREMTATVAAPGTSAEWSEKHPGLVLENPQIRLNHEVEQMPELDFATVTGEQLTAYFSKRKEVVPDRIVKHVATGLVGRELTFSDLQIIRLQATSLDERQTFCCLTANPSKCGLPIVFTVPLSQFDSLPHDPLENDRLHQVRGRVSQSPNKNYDGFYGRREFLSLEQVSIGSLCSDVKCLVDYSPKLSVNQVMQEVDKLPKEFRPPSLLRHCRLNRGRRVTIPDARMGEHLTRTADGTVEFHLMLGNDLRLQV